MDLTFGARSGAHRHHRLSSQSFMSAHIDDAGASALPQEVEVGNIEYKLKLLNPPPERMQHLISQLKWRLAEGHGEAIYEIGVSDNGELVGLSKGDMAASIQTLRRMGEALNADVSLIRERTVFVTPKENKLKEFMLANHNSTNSLENASGEFEDDTDDDLSDGFGFPLDLDELSPLESPVQPSNARLEERLVAEVLVRKGLQDDRHFLEIRVAIVGGADAGKSTLLGVLADSELDNGRGKSRLNLLRHRHEIESGRTSSISHQIIGFNVRGDLVNYGTTNISTPEHICENSTKIISFLDMCGHPKFQKTTLSGFTGHSPDYACLIIGANAGGIGEVPREHLGIAVALMVPVFIVITKVDIASVDQLTRTVNSLLRLLKSPGISRVPTVIQNEDDLVVAVSNLLNSRVIPIFLTSSVTGENMNLLEKFLNLLPSNSQSDGFDIDSNDAQFSIEETYNIQSVGLVVGGLLLSGRISTVHSQRQNVYYLGPDRGRFVPIQVTSIHRQRIPASTITAGQAATCAIMFVRDNMDSDADGNSNPGVKIERRDQRASAELSQNPPNGFKIRKGQVILATCPEEVSAVPPSLQSTIAPSLKLDMAGSVPLSQTPLASSLFRAAEMDSGCVWEFEAHIHVIHGATKLDTNTEVAVGTSGVAYLGSVRQGARIVKLQDSEGKWAGLLNDSEITSSDLTSPESASTDLQAYSSEFFIVPASKSRRRSSSAFTKLQLNAVGPKQMEQEPVLSPNESSSIAWSKRAIDAAQVLPGAVGVFPKRSQQVQFDANITDASSNFATNPPQSNPRSFTPTPTSPRRSAQRVIVGSTAASSGKGSDDAHTPPVLRTGSHGRIRLRFSHEPEWVKVGSTVLFRGVDKLKCVGKVVGIISSGDSAKSPDDVDSFR
ncbi:hypothetical protein HDU83_001190 [Entophlyctis luteolus]|nr:hypothetical protein HDU83_001190 [Entophlyctis luteolus]KAJ3394998.1 hypothetical protein HDU84_004456 [Entophlyctis sp. JEL0112]